MAKIVAIIQARMGSTRLPGKILKTVMGKPLLWYMFNRLHYSHTIDLSVLATSTSPQDNVIEDFAQKYNINLFRGSEQDVLDRYYKAATRYKADIIIRLTGDCPLIDPKIIDKVVNYFLENTEQVDYVQTALSFPDGVDTEVFSYEALEKAWQNATKKSEREHVTPYIWKNTDIFKINAIENDQNLSNLRLVVDYEEDFQVVSEILKNLYKTNSIFYTEDVLNFLEKRPDLQQLNKHRVWRDEGYLKAVAEAD